MSTIAALADMRRRGMMPRGRLIWLGLGFRPPKRNAIVLDPDNLPADRYCVAVAGLDVVLCYPGNLTRYSILRRLCSSLLAGRPRRLQLFDMDLKRLAFLKLGEKGAHHG